MTLEEAIKHIKQLLRWYLKEEPLSETVYKREAVDMAIKALERQEKILSYIDRLLNQGTGKKKSLEFLKKYILEGEKNDE